jgi:hypothetical protein
MSDGVHLLVPFAGGPAEGCRQALRALALPQLARLLARLAPAEADAVPAPVLSMPHEQALARACGLPGADGLIPWAAWQVAQAGRDTYYAGWAWITPCHWQVGQGHVRMEPPQQLQLDPRESQALLAAMQPYFEQDGIRLEYDAPTLWLARGEIFRHLPTASLDRVVGRVIDPWMPRGDAARPLRRLQQEMQMLLYTNPLNDERQAGGLPPVNSFWVSGTGALPPDAPTAPPAGLEIVHYLRDAALRDDWAAWAAAWQQLDAGECARLNAALDQGREVTLTLCGERLARTWRTAPGGLLRKITNLFARPSPAQVLETL